MYGTGNAKVASKINSNPFLIERIIQCQKENDKFPNFITVDFYETGNAMEAVDILNVISKSNKGN